MTYSYNIFQDWKANKGNVKGRLVMLLYRIAHLATMNKIMHIIMIPYLVFYTVVIAWFMSVEIQHRAKIGRNAKMWHGHALVVHKATLIGNDCVLRQCTTFGNKKNSEGKVSGATIGNNVDIGANVCIIGNVIIGDNCVIGAGAVVTKSFPAGSVIVGNHAKLLKLV